MENDLISREQAKDFFHDEQEYFGYMIKKALDIVPIIEQPQGEWIRNLLKPKSNIITYSCTLCGYISNSNKYNFCPNCGAKMT